MHPDYDAQKTIQNELDNEERLLWSGRPNPNRAMLKSLPTLLGGVLFTAFALFWEAMALSAGGWGPLEAHQPIRPTPDPVAVSFPLFGALFVLIGLGMVLAPLWDRMLAKRTAYGVTDKRVLIVVHTLSRSVQSFGPGDLQWLRRTERTNGTGDLTFTSVPVQSWWASGWQWRTTGQEHAMKEIGFFGVPDVQEVERLIRDTHHQSEAQRLNP